MAIEKIDRDKLRDLLNDALSKSSTFKNIEGVNPSRITFDGDEYYVYTKNLSPAQLSNNNPDVWRIQLPIRDIFDYIKESPLPFILLGYDEQNDIYTTWNPYWAKQRLNVAKSVSFYSRLSIQKRARSTGQLQQLELNNDGVVLAFPRENLSYFLQNIQEFFTNESEFVALGSRKRTEANLAYRELINQKNITALSNYMDDCGMSSVTSRNYCNAIRELITNGHFSKNRKIFLSFDSISEYPNAIKPFFEVNELKRINDVWHYTYSAALKKYIDFLIIKLNSTTQNGPNRDEPKPQDDSLGYSIRERPDNVVEDQSKIEIDYDSKFTDEHGKLIRITDPNLIDKLADALNTEYKSPAAAFNVVEDYYGNRFPNMELKDWQALFDSINWDSPYPASSKILTPDSTTDPIDKPKHRIIKVVFPNGRVVKEKKVSDTLVEVVKYAGAKNVRMLYITVCGANMILKKEEIGPKYKVSSKPVGKGLYVNTKSDTDTKLSIIQQISETLQLGLSVELVPFGDEQITEASNVALQKVHEQIKKALPHSSTNKVSSHRKQKTHILKVTFPDGRVIMDEIVCDTFIKAMRYAGVDKVRSLNIKVCGSNVVLDKKSINPRYQRATKLVDNGLYVNTYTPTKVKASIIQKVSDSLSLGLKVEFVSINR